jgi:hypothetical protein
MENVDRNEERDMNGRLICEGLESYIAACYELIEKHEAAGDAKAVEVTKNMLREFEETLEHYMEKM